MTTNREWHEANRMPPRATLQQRIAWHLEHQQHCQCRPMPEKLKQQIVPSGAAAGTAFSTFLAAGGTLPPLSPARELNEMPEIAADEAVQAFARRDLNSGPR